MPSLKVPLKREGRWDFRPVSPEPDQACGGRDSRMLWGPTPPPSTLYPVPTSGQVPKYLRLLSAVWSRLLRSKVNLPPSLPRRGPM